MRDGNIKETYTSILSRLDERIKNLIDRNDADHKEIKSSIKELDNHVNHEIESLNKRINKLEERQWKTLILIIGGSSGLSVTIVKLIELLGGI